MSCHAAHPYLMAPAFFFVPCPRPPTHPPMPSPRPPVHHTTRSVRQTAHRRSHKSSGTPHIAHQRAGSPPASGGDTCPGDGGRSEARPAQQPYHAYPQLSYTHIILLPILVAPTTVAAGEGHTVGVNVHLTHWGAGKVRGFLPYPSLSSLTS